MLDGSFGDAGSGPSDSDLDLAFAVDLGLDLAFERTWLIRFAASLVDRETLLIGLAFPR